MAIVMQAMKHACKDELNSLTLLAGDGDFRDLVEFIKVDQGKEVSIFCY